MYEKEQKERRMKWDWTTLQQFEKHLGAPLTSWEEFKAHCEEKETNGE